MNKLLRRSVTILFAMLLCIGIFSGCAKKDEAFDPDLYEDDEFYDEDEFYEDEYYDDEYYEDEDYDEEPYDEESDASASDNSDIAVGKWYTDGYDEDDNWAMSYVIELKENGKATCVGWRNSDSGTYKVDGNKVTIKFDKCMTDETGKGYSEVEGFEYTVDMIINGDEASIKIDAPDIISNLDDGVMHRSTDPSKIKSKVRSSKGKAKSGKKIKFTTTDIDGNKITSDEIFSKHEVTMVNVWATWCHWCVAELPELNKLNKKLAKKDCAIVGLLGDEDDDIYDAVEIIDENDVDYLNILPWDGATEKDFNMDDGWPTTFFVDREGNIIGDPIVGAQIDEYEKRIDKILSGK